LDGKFFGITLVAFGKDNQTRPFYKEVCKYLGEWPLFDHGDIEGDTNVEGDENYSTDPLHNPTKLLTLDSLGDAKNCDACVKVCTTISFRDTIQPLEVDSVPLLMKP
jgi:hypothetical protein